jgi:hydroxymethylpyrimidine pyrophosphatase-like HAD family hydrolase
VSLRCVYTDLDGTLLGRQGSLLHDADGNFTLRQVRGLEACDRAGVEVVIVSGRRETQVMADARLLGQPSYIYEVGCGVVIDGERTLLTPGWETDDDGTPAQKMLAAGIPELLFGHFGDALEWHAPWHRDRPLSLLFRGKVDPAEANALLAEHGHADLRFLDNGSIAAGREFPGPGMTHAYHLVPGGASKAKGIAFHMRARGYPPEACIAIGDSLEDLEAADVVGRFFMVANGPQRDPGLLEAIAGRPNVTVTEGRNGDGFYEAVISTLAAR